MCVCAFSLLPVFCRFLATTIFLTNFEHTVPLISSFCSKRPALKAQQFPLLSYLHLFWANKDRRKSVCFLLKINEALGHWPNLQCVHISTRPRSQKWTFEHSINGFFCISYKQIILGSANEILTGIFPRLA